MIPVYKCREAIALLQVGTFGCQQKETKHKVEVHDECIASILVRMSRDEVTLNSEKFKPIRLPEGITGRAGS